MVLLIKETIITTNVTAKAAQGSKAKPATRATNTTKAMAAEPSPNVQADSDDKVEQSALADSAAMPLPEATSDETPPAQPIAPVTDGEGAGMM